ncbi:hypothetical protein diail_7279 [Diaporthe ilicicola]|nr:hypothetical protein diail_7279 [Diaporthe ilicicola]
MTALQQIRPPRVKQIILQQSKFSPILAVFYVALLIVPYYVQRGWLIAINILNSLAVALSLPILNALLARAAVDFSQRRRPSQELSARQLFALADRGWYNLAKVKNPWILSALLRFGFALLHLAIVLPLVRPGFVTYEDTRVASNLPAQYDESRRWVVPNPSPVALKKEYSGPVRTGRADAQGLQTTTGGAEDYLWPVCNDNTTTDGTCGFKYGPYELQQSTVSNFWEDASKYLSSTKKYETNGSALMHTSSFTAASSTGSYRNKYVGDYALGLKTGAKCEAVSAGDVVAQCLRSTGAEDMPPPALGWSKSLEIGRELSLGICVPALEKDPWESAEASPWKPINFTEHLYLNLREKSSSTHTGWGCSTWGPDCEDMGDGDGLHIHCQADNMLSYAELGSGKTNGRPTCFLDEMPADFDIPRGHSRLETPTEYDPWDQYMGYDGPLKTAAMAMFGNDSGSTCSALRSRMKPRQTRRLLLC